MVKMVSRLTLGALVLALLSAIMAWSIDFDQLISVIQSARWSFLLPMTLLLVAATATRSVRLALMLNASHWSLFHVQNVGALINALLPLRAGEMFMALIIRHRQGVSGSQVLSIIAVDRLLDLAAVVGLFCLVAPMVPGLPDAAVGALISLGAGMAAIIATMAASFRYRQRIVALLNQHLVSRAPRLAPLVDRGERLLDGFGVVTQRHLVGKALALSFLAWLTSVAACLVGLWAVWPEATPAAAAFAVCMSVFGTMLIAVPSGIGIMHAALVFALGTFGLAADTAFAFALMYHALATLASAMMGYVSVHALGFNLRQAINMCRGKKTTDAAAEPAP